MFLACLAHLAGGGNLPGARVLLGTTLMLALVAGPLTARRCRLGIVVPVLLGEQGLLHLWFSAAAAATSGCGAQLGTVGHHLLVVTPPTACPTGATGMAADAMGSPGWGMWLTHLAATLATGWLLAKGEARLWRATDRLVAVATAAPRRIRALEPLRTVVPYVSSGWTRRGFRPAASRGPPRWVVVP